MKCEYCNKVFKPRHSFQRYCSLECYRKARLKRGWFKGIKEFTEKPFAHVSRAYTKSERKPLPDNYMETDKSISWKYIYNKKQYGELMREYYDKKKTLKS